MLSEERDTLRDMLPRKTLQMLDRAMADRKGISTDVRPRIEAVGGKFTKKAGES